MSPELSLIASSGIEAFRPLLAKLMTSGLEMAGRKAWAAAENLTRGFGKHLEQTFDRCTKIKTILNADEPASLLALYVTTNFGCGGRKLRDLDTIDEIRKHKRAIVSGTGGGGKTMFMKYLWLCFFENPLGKIPFFIELRRLNDLTSDDLLAYIYASVVESHGDITRDQFNNGMRAGSFVFIFDGFDGILVDKRDRLESQLLAIAHNNPDCIVVVSGRSDERFNSWQTFRNYRVRPLTKELVCDLVEKLDYNRTIKRKFIARVKKDLYEQHESFLSSPLLATLMLLTFNQYADIPEKIHVFYDQAFDTLFSRHDASKEGFKRRMRTNLAIDVFKRQLSYFCLLSYYSQKYALSEAELLEFIAKSSRAHQLDLNAIDFMKDLEEAVCLIQKEGLSYTFTHRSFQEFFSAYCLAREDLHNFVHILMTVSRRTSDKVVEMLYEMNPAKLEDLYVIPLLDRLVELIASHGGDDVFSQRFSIYKERLALQVQTTSHMAGFILDGNEFSYLTNVLSCLYPGELGNLANKDRIILVESETSSFVEQLRKKELTPPLFFRLELTDTLNGELLVVHKRVVGKKSKPKLRARIDMEWLRESTWQDFFVGQHEVFPRLLAAIRTRRADRDVVIDDIFGTLQKEPSGAIG